ncbi:O-antigen ligase family protein [Blastococcus colisei]|uniref:O-antigen ligase family protein n=1 Tax=Blastococcus colisei TaxID=1564162 RepID=UPI001476E7EE|nr:O-antigen ligase family protein [Blastococcus colisei]
MGLLAWWIATRLHPRLATRSSHPVTWIVLILIVTVLISYALGYDRGLLPPESSGADRYLIVLASWVGVALVAADGLRTRRDLDRVIGAMVTLSAVSAAVGWLQFYGIDLAPYFRPPGFVYNADLVGVGLRGGPGLSRVYGTQQHYIEFGVVLAMVLPFAIHRALATSNRRTSYLRWTTVALIAGAIPLAISRAGFLGLITGLVVLGLAWPNRMKLWGFLGLVVGMAAFRTAIPGVLGTIKSAFLNYDADPSIQARLADFAATSAYIRDRPWFGRGPGTYVPELYRVLDNQFLGSFLAVGFIGTLALSSVFFTAIIIGRHVRRNATWDVDRHLGQTVTASAAVALITSLTFDSLAFPTFAGIIFFVFGMSGALWRLRDTHEPAPPGVPSLTSPLRAEHPREEMA